MTALIPLGAAVLAVAVAYLFRRQLDMCGADGRTSFAKELIVGVFAAKAAEGGLTTAFCTLIVVAAFGRGPLMALIGRTTVNLQDMTQRIRQEVSTLTVTRREDLGIEDTP